MEMTAQYSETFRACSYDGDVYNNLQPGAILRFAQQIAIDQCTELVMDTEFYQRTHTAFLMARQTLVFQTPAPARGEYTLVTHPSGMKRAAYRRYTRVLNSEGEQVACLDSVWMLVDTDTKRILRREPEGYGAVQWPQQVEYPELDLKLTRAAELEDCGKRRAGYTLCDENGHLNNTRYADLFLDALPAGALTPSGVQQITLYYHRETPLGQSFSLRRGQAEPGAWYLCGERDGLCCVEGNIWLNP